METIIGVRFKKAGKVYYFSPGALTVEKDDRVVVETLRGVECGTVVLAPREVTPEEMVHPLKIVQRLANEGDLKRMEENKKREREAFGIGVEKIRARHLSMKLIDVEYAFDMSRITFYFTADGRIDFRELVKDLAAVFRTRIELRQIGVRDEAKLMGGIGCCGRPLCCASFLGDFEPVSIRMAKEQNLSLNPTKISGICGRLMCCLKYESNCYDGEGGCCARQQRVQAPEQGSHVATADGDGKVISINYQRRMATILLDNSRTVVTSWEDVVASDAQSDEPEGAYARRDARETKEGHRRSRHAQDGRERRVNAPHETKDREAKRIGSDGSRRRSRSQDNRRERAQGRKNRRDAQQNRRGSATRTQQDRREDTKQKGEPK
ncbi:stage 0 sporulation family protein [uncultured Mitsuokella sp.]|uniref:PSP1 domain-containing protein n=1 Tax=uncultured Mitsuokella sp. TaxID=453120 RepID=UPI00263363EF|nr:stage 0 sporulation family protein [uncultured Mitsuokella sp.]